MWMIPNPSGAKLLLATIAVLFIGLSKAGFGGGLGILTTPLCVFAFGSQYALGILLPLLCAGDLFSMHQYWRKWEVRNLWLLLPGVVIGVIVGVCLLNQFSPRQLNFIIGLIAVCFVLFHLTKEKLLRFPDRFIPTRRTGIPFGIGAGITSTFAHGAGPVVTLFLLPQQMTKEIYVATNVLVFTWINWIKFPFFVGNGQITPASMRASLAFLPLVPYGVRQGVWLNRRISDRHFRRFIYLFTFLAGLQLMFNFHW